MTARHAGLRPALVAALLAAVLGAFPALAAEPAADYALSYVWTDSLVVALDYMAQLGEILGDELESQLHVVREVVQGEPGRFGIVFEPAGGRAAAIDSVTAHNEKLVAAGYDRAQLLGRDGYFELFNLSYGVGPNLALQKRNYRLLQEVLGPEVARDLVIERTRVGKYALVWKRLGEMHSGAKVVRRHRRILQRHGLDAALIREQNNEPVYGQASVLHEEMLGPETEPEAADVGDTSGVDSVEVVPESIHASLPENGIDSELEARIEHYIKELRRRGLLAPDERTSWSVYDFTSDRKLVSINEDYEFQAASMIKPLVALAFFHRAARRELVYGPRSRHHMTRMIQQSSNSSTNWIMRQVGGPAAVQRILTRHFPGIFQNTQIVEYIPPGGRTYRNKASAHDYSRFLYALWQERLPYSRELKRLMALPGSDRIYHGVPNIPQGTLVYNKTGTTSKLVGDMGILVARGRDGSRYPYTLIAIIERPDRRGSFSRFVQHRGDVIRKVSEIVYDELGRTHGFR